MKKKTLLLTLALTVAMSTTALAGCGTETANEEKTAVEETPVVQDDTVEVAEESEATDNLENDIIQFEEPGTISEYILDNLEYEDESTEITATSQIPVYSIEGIYVGYVKEGATITLTQHGIGSDGAITIWHRFKNPVEGTDYEYLYVSQKDFESGGNEGSVTKEMVREAIENSLMSSVVEHTILDTKPSDMEGSVTVTVAKDNTAYAEVAQNQLYYPEDGTDNILNWSTYYIEFTSEDDTSIEYTVYYKDALDLDQLKEDYKNSQN